MATKPQTKNKWIILGLILVFIVPIILAWVIFQNKLLLFGTINHGALIKNPINVATLKLTTTTGKAIPVEIFTNKWSLIILQNNNCNKLCEKWLFQLRQIRLALGKDMDRMQRILVTEPQQSQLTLQNLLNKDFRGTLHFYINKDALSMFQKETTAQNLKMHSDTNDRNHKIVAIQPTSIYLVDPAGRIMMFYPSDSNPKGILQDLKRLIYVAKTK